MGKPLSFNLQTPTRPRHYLLGPRCPGALPKLPKQPELQLLDHIDHPACLRCVAHEAEIPLDLPLQLTLHPRGQAPAQISFVL